MDAAKTAAQESGVRRHRESKDRKHDDDDDEEEEAGDSSNTSLARPPAKSKTKEKDGAGSAGERRWGGIPGIGYRSGRIIRTPHSRFPASRRRQRLSRRRWRPPGEGVWTGVGRFNVNGNRQICA